jgi:hypothetical protein
MKKNDVFKRKKKIGCIQEEEKNRMYSRGRKK